MRLGRTGRYRPVIACGLAIVVSGALTACGDGSSKTNSEGVTEISVTSSGVFLTSAPLYIAQEKGYFAKEKLNVKVTTTSGGPTAVSALFSGSAQVALAGLNQVASSTANGKPILAFAATNDQLPLQVVVSNKLWDENNLGSADLATKINVLKGKKLGVVSPTGQNGLVFDALFKEVGTDRKGANATYVVLGDPKTIVTAFTQGRIDAFNLNPFYPEDVQAQGKGHITIDVAKGEVPSLAGMVNSGFMTTPDYVKSNGDVLQRFTNAVAAAERWEAQNPVEASQLLQKTHFPQTPLDLLQSTFEALLQNKGLSPSPVIDPAGYEKFIKFTLSAPNSPKLTAPMESLFTNQFAEPAAKAAESTVS